MHHSFKFLIHTRLSRVNYAYVNDLVTSTLGLTYHSNDRAIINKRHGGYSVINLLVTCVPMSGKTSNVIVHSHIEIALSISIILTIFVFPFFINRNDY